MSNLFATGKARVAAMKARFASSAYDRNAVGRIPDFVVTNAGDLQRMERLVADMRASPPPPPRKPAGMSRHKISQWLARERRWLNASGEERGTAAHEAGHVAAGFVLGARVTYARAQPVAQSSGVAFVDSDGLAPLSRAVIAFAGAAAESKQVNETRHPSPSDITIARQAVAEANRERVFALAFQQAGQLVAKHWNAIEELRDELLRAVFMDEQELADWRIRFTENGGKQ
jgi:hypothetical protein